MMTRRHLLIVLPVILCALLTPRLASAGFFFGKKAKPTPAEHVPELIKTLKTDGDEHKRSSAAEELRQYDPMQFPEMIPALIDALFNDHKPGVRAEAAQTLGKLRPVSPAVGAALEQALAKDGSMRVRLQARSSLLQYRWAGYTPKAKDESQPPAQTKEPPLAQEPPLAPQPQLAPQSPPPAATTVPRLVPVPVTTTTLPSSPRPLPVGPAKRTTPPPQPAETGPELTPP